MDFSLTGLFKIFEHGLTIVGFIVFTYWIIKWVSTFTNKQKELSDIEKTINETLKEAWNQEKRLRERELVNYKEELNILEKKVNTKQTKLEKLENHIIEFYISTIISSKIAEDRLKKVIDKTRESFNKVTKLIMQNTELTPQKYFKLIENGFNAKRPPGKYEEKLLYYYYYNLKSFIQLSETMSILAFTIPSVTTRKNDLITIDPKMQKDIDEIKIKSQNFKKVKYVL